MDERSVRSKNRGGPPELRAKLVKSISKLPAQAPRDLGKRQVQRGLGEHVRQRVLQHQHLGVAGAEAEARKQSKNYFFDLFWTFFNSLF